MTVNVLCSVLWLLLTVPWVALQCVIVVFPHHPIMNIRVNKLYKVYQTEIYLLQVCVQQ